MINYNKLCSDLFKGLSSRTREVIEKRFGFQGEKMTLEAIGQELGLCRERVRQIERDGFADLDSQKKGCQQAFQVFAKYLESFGGLRRESLLLEELGGSDHRAHVCFLLHLGGFKKIGASEDLHSLWVNNSKFLPKAKKLISGLNKKLNKRKELLSLDDLYHIYRKELSAQVGNLGKNAFASYLNASKAISKGPSGLFGLKTWPEINPRGVRDKAYLVFKQEDKPLHFAQVASHITNLSPDKQANVQTVHNELIKDNRFVLIGRGLYALTEWGYRPGCVKDVIADVLKKSGPLGKEEIMEKVLTQRQVKKNTVLLNLNNKNYFLRDNQGRYREA